MEHRELLRTGKFRHLLSRGGNILLIFPVHANGLVDVWWQIETIRSLLTLGKTIVQVQEYDVDTSSGTSDYTSEEDTVDVIDLTGTQLRL